VLKLGNTGSSINTGPWSVLAVVDDFMTQKCSYICTAILKKTYLANYSCGPAFICPLENVHTVHMQSCQTGRDPCTVHLVEGEFRDDQMRNIEVKKTTEFLLHDRLQTRLGIDSSSESLNSMSFQQWTIPTMRAKLHLQTPGCLSPRNARANLTPTPTLRPSRSHEEFFISPQAEQVHHLCSMNVSHRTQFQPIVSVAMGRGVVHRGRCVAASPELAAATAP